MWRRENESFPLETVNRVPIRSDGGGPSRRRETDACNNAPNRGATVGKQNGHRGMGMGVVGMGI